MKKSLVNIGGAILFYSVIVFGILLLNIRFKYLNDLEIEKNPNNYVAMNK